MHDYGFPLGMQVLFNDNGVVKEGTVVGHTMVSLPPIASDYTVPFNAVLVVIPGAYECSQEYTWWPEDSVVAAEYADRTMLKPENDVYARWRNSI